MTRIFSSVWGVVALILACAVFLPLVGSPYVVNLATIIAIYGMLAFGLGVLVCMTGQLSMGHGALFGLGAYATAYLVAEAGMGFWPAIFCAAAITAVAGAFIGAVSLRFEGIFFAIVTFAFSALISSALVNMRSITGGANGLMANFAPPSIGGWADFNRPDHFFVAVAVALAVCATLIGALTRTRFGRACISIREDQVLARCLGVNAFRHKLAAFVISSAIAGFAGGWYASYLKYIAPDLFTVHLSIEMIMILIIGGVFNPVVGPLVGVVIFVLLPESLRFAAAYRAMAFGLLAIAIIITMPDGIAGTVSKLLRRWRGREDQAAPKAPAIEGQSK